MWVSHMKRSSVGRESAIWLFLIGLFSMTQIRLVAKIGISEAGMLIAAPILFFQDLPSLKRDGVLPLLNFAFIWLGGACLSDWINGSSFAQMFRGVAVPYVICSTVIVIHHFIKNDVRSCKWLIFGLACSSVLSIFIFQRGMAGDMAAEGDVAGAIERVVGYKLFWAFTIKTWLLLPVQTMYLSVPFFYSFFAVCVASIAAWLTGGRSSFLVSVFSLVMLIYARKRFRAMRQIKKHIVVVLLVLGGIGAVVKWGYKYAGQHGYLNEYETKKFERQTQAGDSVLKLLMAGRGEFFISCFAIWDRPIIGHGSWAIDRRGYTQEFLVKYGTEEDIMALRRREDKISDMGGLATIPTHSHITTAWLWHGIAGGMFWIYVGILAGKAFIRRLHLVPELYGYLVIALPNIAWDILFSPFGLRTEECLLFTILAMLGKIEKSQRAMGRLW